VLRPPTLRPRGTYTQWFWPDPPAGGFAGFEHVLVPEVDPGPRTHYFWAHQFRTVDGEGGYIGLQTRGNRADGSMGKMAIFSLWDALAADGPGFVPFSGEGSGWSCRIPWLWEAGRPYRLRVGVAESDERAVWWGAWVDGTEIGRIRYPAAWGLLRPWSIYWTEYYGPPVADCADLAYSRVTFSEPTAEGGAVRPARRRSHIGDGECQNSRTTDVEEGVRHEMGIPPRW
jgi:hypothetical protein